MKCFELIRACLYGQKLSRLARKHFDKSNNFVLIIWKNVIPLISGTVSSCDVDIVKCEQKVFSPGGKVVYIWEVCPICSRVCRDHACQQARSRTREILFSSPMKAM